MAHEPNAILSHVQCGSNLGRYSAAHGSLAEPLLPWLGPACSNHGIAVRFGGARQLPFQHWGMPLGALAPSFSMQLHAFNPWTSENYQMQLGRLECLATLGINTARLDVLKSFPCQKSNF